MSKPEFERIVEFEPAFDKRSPDPKKNYGIHGVEMRWVLKGEKGAVQFLVFTQWQLPHVTREGIERMDRGVSNVAMELKCFWVPMAADLGYHSKVPMYDGQEPMGHTCEYLDGAPCYYDGSGLHAEKVLLMLIEKGGESVWQYMAECYHEQFDKLPVAKEP